MSAASPATTSVSADLAFALELADLADAISLPRFRSADLRVSTKPDRSFVTDADTAVERTLRERIERCRPDDGFFGEESGAADRGDRRWIIDPIDGTANFLRGVPNWATLIALEVAGEPRLGVVSAPAFGARWWAETGGGAWAVGPDVGAPSGTGFEPAREPVSDSQRDSVDSSGSTAQPDSTTQPGQPRRLRVSGVADLADASLSFQSVRQWEEAGHLQPLLALCRAVWRDRAYGDMWSYMLLAEGQLDLVGEFDVKAYDLAALVPIVREAGGRFTDIEGSPSAWNGSSLASNGLLHERAIETIRSAR